MLMKIRNPQDRAAMETAWRYELQPRRSDKWYQIRRDRISFKPCDTIETQQQIIRFFDALRADLEVVVRGRYFRNRKCLILNLNYNGGDF